MRPALLLSAAALAALSVLAWLGRRDAGRALRAADALIARIEELERRLASREHAGSPAAPPAALAAAARSGAPPPAPSDEEASRLEERLTALEARIATLAAAAPDGTEDPDPLRVRVLNSALERGDVLEARRLLAEGLDPDARDDDGRTPLATAARTGDIEIVELVLAHGAGLERTSGKRRMTPLLDALDARQAETALLLLDRGADPAAADKNGESALTWASHAGAEAVVRRLLAEGVEIDRASNWGGTPLASAAARGHLAIVRLLIDAGADPLRADDAGRTPLARAVEEGHVDVAELLRARGAR